MIRRLERSREIAVPLTTAASNQRIKPRASNPLNPSRQGNLGVLASNLPGIVSQAAVNPSFVDRMIRAARLDPQLYEEVEADTGANGQAIAVVVLASVAAGIGGGGTVGSLIGGSIGALIAWYIWAFLTFWIGTRLLPEAGTRATQGELLRTIAFSSSPGLLRILGILPALQALAFLVSGVWMLVAMVIAVRQALDYRSTGRAVGVCLIGWIVQAILLALTLGLLRG